jgi:hypothetical protein
MDNNGVPNSVEHLLLDSYALEKLQDLVDKECSAEQIITSWPEHWEDAGAIPIWKCRICNRLYIDPFGTSGEIVVYSIETTIKKQ